MHGRGGNDTLHASDGVSDLCYGGDGTGDTCTDRDKAPSEIVDSVGDDIENI
jgi:hypothetical protein